MRNNLTDDEDLVTRRRDGPPGEHASVGRPESGAGEHASTRSPDFAAIAAAGMRAWERPCEGFRDWEFSYL
jgi:hypothetical protein